MIDLVIQNGKVVTSEGVLETGIGVDEGIIVVLGSEKHLPEAKKGLMLVDYISYLDSWMITFILETRG